VDALGDVSPDAYARLAAQGLGLVASQWAVALLRCRAPARLNPSHPPSIDRQYFSSGSPAKCFQVPCNEMGPALFSLLWPWKFYLPQGERGNPWLTRQSPFHQLLAVS